MTDGSSLTRAVDTAWSVYRATRPEVDTTDGRRCLLERRLHRRWEAHGSDVEELTGFGIAFSRAFPNRNVETGGGEPRRLAGASARPNWTLLAISYAISAAVVISLHSALD